MNVLKFLLGAVVILLMSGYLILPRYYFTDPPQCRDTETIPDHLSIESTRYQESILEILMTSEPDDFRYFFRSFEGNDKSRVIVNFRNEFHCFDVKMLIREVPEINKMKNTDGQSYPGELYEVKWEINHDSSPAGVIMTGMHRIID